MKPITSRMVILLLLTTTASRRVDGADQSPDVTAPRSEKPAISMPPELIDIHGLTINLRMLAKRRQLVVVTMKATWCRVCVQQLRRLRRLQQKLEQCGATFIVLELRADQIVPALFSVDPAGRIGWMQRGRAPGLYADDILLELLECEDREPSHRAHRRDDPHTEALTAPRDPTCGL